MGPVYVSVKLLLSGIMKDPLLRKSRSASVPRSISSSLPWAERLGKSIQSTGRRLRLGLQVCKSEPG